MKDISSRKSFLKKTALALGGIVLGGVFLRNIFFPKSNSDQSNLFNKDKSSMIANGILSTEKLGFQWPTADPFLFCVHHEDFYPKGNSNSGPEASLSGRDIGQDFTPKDGWRMYHGQKVPGFPGHPHRGFETVTVVERGLVDHADSQGAAGRYGGGDVQWMTAGAGIQHSEMFPLLSKDKENTLELFQIWMNLPARSKFVEPHFKMLWSEQIPVLDVKDSNNNNTKVKIIAGSYNGTNSIQPTPNSWAADPANEVNIWILQLDPNAEFTIPAMSAGLNRNLYYFRGKGLSANGLEIPEYNRAILESDKDIHLVNGEEEGKILFLQGKPISEPIAQYGPFVMNTQAEIQQAFNDYQRTQFGGWPWQTYEPVHEGKGRFAKFANGKEELPS
ncbi:MAG: pirin family protein [Leptospira sp.]|nr:pirin family protein [Leptospira sp.]